MRSCLVMTVVVMVVVVLVVGVEGGGRRRKKEGGGGDRPTQHRKRHNRRRMTDTWSVSEGGEEDQEVRRWWENQPGDSGGPHHNHHNNNHHNNNHHHRPHHRFNVSRHHHPRPSLHGPGGGSQLSSSPSSWVGPLSQLGPHDLADLGGDLYTGWSPWSRCSRRCKQRRRRSCRAPAVCGKAVLKEERGCAGGRCSGRRPFHIIRQEEFSRQPPRNDMRVLLNFNSMFYTRWSRWSPCSRSCLTRRYRSCKYPLFCGGSVVHEEAYCYVEGSMCETWYRRGSHHPRPHHQQHPQHHIPRDRHVPSHSPASPSRTTSVTTTAPNNAAPISTPNIAALNNATPSNNNASGSVCGVSQVTTPPWSLRIIGGKPAQPGEWPWQVVILNRYHEAFCGGTVVGSRWVLTAAHCVRKKLYVRLGEHDLAIREGPEMEYKVWRSVTHPQYDATTVDNDVALLELPEPVVGAGAGTGVLPACLPHQGSPLPVGETCTIIGWGKERNTHIFGTDVLHEAEVPIIPNSVCGSVYRDYYITDNMFCAGYSRGRVDSCAGDSGGPLLCQRQGKWYIYGITSFGDGCGKRGKFGIYARVSNYRHWIEGVINT